MWHCVYSDVYHSSINLRRKLRFKEKTAENTNKILPLLLKTEDFYKADAVRCLFTLYTAFEKASCAQKEATGLSESGSNFEKLPLVMNPKKKGPEFYFIFFSLFGRSVLKVLLFTYAKVHFSFSWSHLRLPS